MRNCSCITKTFSDDFLFFHQLFDLSGKPLLMMLSNNYHRKNVLLSRDVVFSTILKIYMF